MKHRVIIVLLCFAIIFSGCITNPDYKESFCPNYVQSGSMMFPTYFCPDENGIGQQFDCGYVGGEGSNELGCFWLEEAKR